MSQMGKVLQLRLELRRRVALLLLVHLLLLLLLLRRRREAEVRGGETGLLAEGRAELQREGGQGLGLGGAERAQLRALLQLLRGMVLLLLLMLLLLCRECCGHHGQRLRISVAAHQRAEQLLCLSM